MSQGRETTLFKVGAESVHTWAYAALSRFDAYLSLLLQGANHVNWLVGFCAHSEVGQERLQTLLRHPATQSLRGKMPGVAK